MLPTMSLDSFHTAHLDPASGYGLVVCPRPEDDVVLDGSSLFASAWELACRSLASLGWAPVRDEAFAQRVLAGLASGGYAEAIARVAALLARTGEPIPLARLDLKRSLIRKYDALLPRVPAGEWRRVRGEQEVAVELEPDRALDTLAALIPQAADRSRLLELLGHMIEEGRRHGVRPTQAQVAMLARIRAVLGADTPRLRSRAPRGRRMA